MWLIYSAIAALSFAAMQTLFKQLTRMGLPAAVILVFVFGFSMLLFATHLGVQRQPVEVSGRALAVLAAAAAFSYVGNLYMVRALDQAPNAGYAMAIIGLQALPVLAASVVFFGAELTLVKGVGVLLSVAGVGLLML
jgi:drug/metabolite transporter (DMT)-like permease